MQSYDPSIYAIGDFQGDIHSESIPLANSGLGVYKKLVGAVLYGDTADGGWYQELLEQERDIMGIRDRMIFGRGHV